MFVRRGVQTLLSIPVPILRQLASLQVVWRQERRDLTRLCMIFRKSSLSSQTDQVLGRLAICHTGGPVLGHVFELGATGGAVTTVG